MWTERGLFIATSTLSLIFIAAAVHSWLWHIPRKPPPRTNLLNRLWRWLTGARYLEINSSLPRDEALRAIQNMPHTRVQTGGWAFHMRIRYLHHWSIPNRMRAGSVRGTVEETENGSLVRVIVGLAPIEWLLLFGLGLFALVFTIVIFAMWGQVLLPRTFGTEMDASFSDALFFTPTLGGIIALIVNAIYRGWRRRRDVIAELQSLK